MHPTGITVAAGITGSGRLQLNSLFHQHSLCHRKQTLYKSDSTDNPSAFRWHFQLHHHTSLLGAYMHLTLDTSLIYFKICSNHSSSYQNIQNTQKYFSQFFCIFTHTCSDILSFFCLTCSTKVCILLPSQGLIPSREALTGSLAQPDKLAVCQLRR